ncbi:hypothetical protein DFH07DRAFT_780811 [Mycena maculata]|uniref:Myb-like domain-containing protein n=1 Tax=Mycena maculata TaxID=230809 RepID=A0AAD7MUK4_9AGAR|nr:hypothetical protein DFH07DRAFT_780811 [Mycena maculata]
MPPKKKKDDEKTQRCTWSDSDNAILVATLRKAKEDGFQADSRWKPQTWAHCVEALKDSPGPTKTAEKCQDHWGKSLKNSYNIVSAICHASGFGWDDGLKIPTAASDVWDAYIKTQTQTDLDSESQSGASGDLDATVQDPATPHRSPRHSHGQDRDNGDGPWAR